jgi:hypothetical protein
MPKLIGNPMDSKDYQSYQMAIALANLAGRSSCAASSFGASEMTNPSEEKNAPEIVKMLHSGQVLVVNSRRRNGLILYKGFHAEFAGPGAAVGSIYDLDCSLAIPVGNLSLLSPDSHEERQKAYLIRRQWIRLMKQITEKPVPQQRVQKILEQFEQYFDAETVAQLPDEAFALLVGVLPQTVSAVRRSYRSFNQQGK